MYRYDLLRYTCFRGQVAHLAFPHLVYLFQNSRWGRAGYSLPCDNGDW